MVWSRLSRWWRTAYHQASIWHPSQQINMTEARNGVVRRGKGSFPLLSTSFLSSVMWICCKGVGFEAPRKQIFVILLAPLGLTPSILLASTVHLLTSCLREIKSKCMSCDRFGCSAQGKPLWGKDVYWALTAVDNPSDRTFKALPETKDMLRICKHVQRAWS